MTAATVRKPVIPEPSNRWSIVHGAVHVMLSVDLDNVTVIYSYNTINVTLSLVDRPNQHWISATSLGDAIRTQTILGREVFRSPEIDCGGVFSEYSTAIVTGTAADIEVVLQGIPYFYRCIQDAEERKALRAVYRWLTKHAATN